MKIYMPTERALRKPTDPAQDNGQFINPPTYATFGGLTGPSKTRGRNNLRVQKGNRTK